MFFARGRSGLVFLDGQSYEPLFHRRRLPGHVHWHPQEPNLMYFFNRSEQKFGLYDPRRDEVVWSRRVEGTFDEVRKGAAPVLPWKAASSRKCTSCKCN